MNKEPLFSVIIPTFNRADQLYRALDSINKQTFREFEVIVCDDGSTDRTKEVVEYFREKFDLKYIYEKNWGGPARPRNNGLKIAQGEYIAFLDSDDWWYPRKLEAVAGYMGKADVSYHDLDVYSPKGKSKTVKIRGRNFTPPPLADILKNGNVMTTSSVVVKKEFLNQLCIVEKREKYYVFNEGTISKKKLFSCYPEMSGKLEQYFIDPYDNYLIVRPYLEVQINDDLFDSNRKKLIFRDLRKAAIENYEDFDLWLRLSIHAKEIVYIPKSLGAYWVGRGNRSEAAEWFINGFRDIYNRYLVHLDAEDQAQARIYMAYIIGRCKQKMGKHDEALESLRIAVKTNNLKYKYRSILLIAYIMFCRVLKIIRRELRLREDI